MEIYDALGDEIIIGKKYGFTRSKNGIAHTVLGEASKITKTGRVSLKVISVKKYCWGKLIENDKKISNVSSIYPFMLFPVSCFLLRNIFK